MRALRPPQIVEALDASIAGQDQAKRAIAVALRNRWRVQQAGNVRSDDLTIHRYALAGGRGCGKSLLVERAAQTVDAPFARVTLAQLAAYETPQRAIAHVFEQLVDVASNRCAGLDRAGSLREAENAGIVLVDGIDRWVHQGDDISSELLERAQQALFGLAALEDVETRDGPMTTRNVMVFATGNLFGGRAGDIPYELQVLFPKRIDLDPLHESDLLRVLQREESSPITAYVALLSAEGITVRFTDDAVQAIAAEAADQNRRIEDIGARRLETLIEHVLDDLLYANPDPAGQQVTIDAAFVIDHIGGDQDDEDLEDFIL